MAKSVMSGETAPEPESEDFQETEWVVAKSLLDANAHSTQAFEYYLMQQFCADASSDWTSMQECLRQAIDKHEQIIEELELASQAIAELQGENRS